MVPVNILVAVHGFEPEGWTHEVPRVIAAHGDARLRVLMVLDTPPVAFTSLVPAARRRFDAALAETRQRETARVSATVGALITALPVPPKCSACEPGDRTPAAASWPTRHSGRQMW